MSASKALVAAPERPAVMGRYKPDWLEKPTADDMEWAYPAHAQRKEIDGKAVINCKVGYDGLLRDCRIVSEAPAGEDFGVAALALSQKFRMIPPEAGADSLPDVTIPVVFQVPRSEPFQPKTAGEASPVFTLLQLFRVGLVKEEQRGPAKPPQPLPAHDQKVVAGIAAVAFVLLVAMVLGLGHRRKPRRP
ncbi:MAG: hypothetical protein B7Y78_09765 [Caulobacter sp. 35-67-4]|nr:MAG: hypothetical protein B7Y81_14895 [Caulobacter sp. 32-67-35]OYX92709.1 MAG: hypothetical protein B7Y78_09765 [Caulobacter sp. 35-67-4]